MRTMSPRRRSTETSGVGNVARVRVTVRVAEPRRTAMRTVESSAPRSSAATAGTSEADTSRLCCIFITRWATWLATVIGYIRMVCGSLRVSSIGGTAAPTSRRTPYGAVAMASRLRAVLWLASVFRIVPLGPCRRQINMGIPGASSSVTGGAIGKRVLLAEPRGYCAGVDRAVETVERALEKHGAPVYVRHEIVHNLHVVDTLAGAGAIFVDETDEVPGAPSWSSRPTASRRRCTSARRAQPSGHRRHLPVGHQGAQRGQAVRPRRLRHPADRPRGPRGGRRHRRRGARPRAAGRRSGRRRQRHRARRGQGDLAVADHPGASTRRWRPCSGCGERFPKLQDPPSDDICYATQNRQVAVKAMAPECELVIVVGSRNSSNSVRLVEVALGAGSRCVLSGGLRRRHRPGLA